MAALCATREDRATLAIPSMEGIGLRLPVETPSNLSCSSVDTANDDPKAAHPAAIGIVLGGRLNAADTASSVTSDPSPFVIVVPRDDGRLVCLQG